MNHKINLLYVALSLMLLFVGLLALLAMPEETLPIGQWIWLLLASKAVALLAFALAIYIIKRIERV